MHQVRNRVRETKIYSVPRELFFPNVMNYLLSKILQKFKITPVVLRGKKFPFFSHPLLIIGLTELISMD